MQLLTNQSCRSASYLFTFVLLIFSQLLSNCRVYAEEQPQSAATPQAGSAQSNLFDLLELRVKGNTLLERQAIEKTVYAFLGKQKTIEQVENARKALESLYHNKGYQTITVDIPEQNVVNGIVYLQVTEGKVSRLRVTESRYFSLGAIKAKVPELAEGTVPNMPVMQEQLAALAKESPDRTVTPILRAGETPGTLEVDLKVKDELPLHGKIELNGRNTATTDRLRAIASVHYDNLWQKFHSASLMFQTTPENPNQVDVVVGSYVMPVIDNDKRLAFFAVNSSSNSITNAGALSVVGGGQIYGLRFVDPLITNVKNLYQTFTAGVSYKDFQQNLTGQQVGALFRKTPISYLPFLLGYSGNLKLDEATIGLTLNANFSLRNIGNNQGEFEQSRYLAKSDYAYLNGGLSFSHNLPFGMEFQSRFNGQVADSPLIPNEQFSIGGMQSVRGYYETELLTDSGVQGSLELYTPRINVEDWPDYNKIRGLVFFDAGKGWVQNALSGSPSQSDIASAGSGFRVQLWKTLTANFDVGVPFVNQIRVERGNPRLHFQVFTEF